MSTFRASMTVLRPSSEGTGPVCVRASCSMSLAFCIESCNSSHFVSTMDAKGVRQTGTTSDRRQEALAFLVLATVRTKGLLRNHHGSQLEEEMAPAWTCRGTGGCGTNLIGGHLKDGWRCNLHCTEANTKDKWDKRDVETKKLEASCASEPAAPQKIQKQSAVVDESKSPRIYQQAGEETEEHSICARMAVKLQIEGEEARTTRRS